MTEKVEETALNVYRKSARGRGIHRFTSGWSTWRWLSGVSSKEKQWFLGTLQGRGGYEAWMAHLVRGLQESSFLLKFEALVLRRSSWSSML